MLTRIYSKHLGGKIKGRVEQTLTVNKPLGELVKDVLE